MGTRCAVVGYGASFDMGKNHANWVTQTPDLELVAVCDHDPERARAAAADWPEKEIYEDVDEMLRKSDIDLVSVVTEHNAHAPVAIKCLNAGKHVIVEKPMCITVEEASSMMEAARENGVMLTVFHQRRLDGDYQAIKEVVNKGLIGKIFHVEMFGGGYGKPPKWWRSDKEISGGAFYDWGAHYLDWLLGLVDSRVTQVSGYFHNLVWDDVSNEDQVRAVIEFENQVVADVQFSSIARASKPRWYILGTEGAIVDRGGKSFKLYSNLDGIPIESEIPYKQSNWAGYYQNISQHLHEGQPLMVKPEEAARVIDIMQTAERSAKSGKKEQLILPQ